MHAIIENHPDWIAFVNERAKAASALERFEGKSARDQAAYQAASLQAFEAGSTIPEPPQDPTAGRRVHGEQVRLIESREHAWIAENAEELTAALLLREDEIVERTKEILVELDGFIGELNDIWSGLTRAHQASVGFGMHQSTGVNLGLLVESARRDTRMMREPFTPDFGANRVGAMGAA